METSSPDPLDYANPMSRLAQAPGEVEYPVPAPDRCIRILFTLAPCSVLVVVSLGWPPSAPFLLTFAGAFASIQLAAPFGRWVALMNDHLSEAREQRVSPLDWAIVRREFNTTPRIYQGFVPVGYSPSAQARARRRFLRLGRRWRRCFMDMSGFMVMPGDSAMFPTVLPAWRYRTPSRYGLRDFVGRGGTVPQRLFRLPIGQCHLV